MANEYISKQDALASLPQQISIQNPHMKGYVKGYNGCKFDAERAIKNLEPADVVPVVHAHWIPQKENYEFKEAWMKCSACGYPVSKWTGNTNFCPNCGAKMDGKKRK